MVEHIGTDPMFFCLQNRCFPIKLMPHNILKVGMVGLEPTFSITNYEYTHYECVSIHSHYRKKYFRQDSNLQGYI